VEIYVAVLHRQGLDGRLLLSEVLGADADHRKAAALFTDKLMDEASFSELGKVVLSMEHIHSVTVHRVTVADPKEMAYKRAWDWLANRVKESAEGWKGQEEKYEEDGALRSRHHAGGQASALSHIVEEMDEARETFGLD
jgi:hypothetical protein